jgi:hypothetical protein
MSMTQAIEDQITMLTDTIYSEPNPVERLRALRILERSLVQRLRKLKREAAYDAAMTMPSSEVAHRLEMDRKDVEYLVRCYLGDNPHKPAPPRRKRHAIDAFVDLSREQ